MAGFITVAVGVAGYILAVQQIGVLAFIATGAGGVQEVVPLGEFGLFCGLLPGPARVTVGTGILLEHIGPGRMRFHRDGNVFALKIDFAGGGGVGMRAVFRHQIGRHQGAVGGHSGGGRGGGRSLGGRGGGRNLGGLSGGRDLGGFSGGRNLGGFSGGRSLGGRSGGRSGLGGALQRGLGQRLMRRLLRDYPAGQQQSQDQHQDQYPGKRGLHPFHPFHRQIQCAYTQKLPVCSKQSIPVHPSRYGYCCAPGSFFMFY